MSREMKKKELRGVDKDPVTKFGNVSGSVPKIGGGGVRYPIILARERLSRPGYDEADHQPVERGEVRTSSLILPVHYEAMSNCIDVGSDFGISLLYVLTILPDE